MSDETPEKKSHWRTTLIGILYAVTEAVMSIPDWETMDWKTLGQKALRVGFVVALSYLAADAKNAK